MEQDLISKKELLEKTGISYGQLYRWKRKNLIPEEWFIRKSTFTGQETFFPREKVLARIEKIKNMKEDLSLDDLADMFSPALAERALSKRELMEQNIVSKIAVELLIEFLGDTEVFPFERVLFVYVLDQVLREGEISREEGRIVLNTLEENYRKLQGKNVELVFLRKLGVSTGFLVLSPSEFFFESGVRVVFRLNLLSSIEELKMLIRSKTVEEG